MRLNLAKDWYERQVEREVNREVAAGRAPHLAALLAETVPVDRLVDAVVAATWPEEALLSRREPA